MAEDNLSIIRKRLHFRCWHRGTREMDLLLGRFADAELEGMSPAMLKDFDAFLNNPDPDIYNWVSGLESLPTDQVSPLSQALLAFYARPRS